MLELFNRWIPGRLRRALEPAGGGFKIEPGQIVEIQKKGEDFYYWTKVDSVMDEELLVHPPEIRGREASFPEGTSVEVRIMSGASVQIVTGSVLDNAGKPGLRISRTSMKESIQQGRRHLRVPAIVPVVLRRTSDGIMPVGDPILGQTSNLSPGGISAVVDKGFDLGQELCVSLQLPDRATAITGTVKTISPINENKFRIGVLFHAISEEDEAAITRLVYEYQRRRGAAGENS